MTSPDAQRTLVVEADLLREAAEALEHSRECILNEGWGEQVERNDRVAALLRQRLEGSKG